MSLVQKYNNYFSYTIIFSLLNMAGIFSVFGARVYGDTERYLNIIHWIWGRQVTEDPIGFLRPLGPLLAAPFEFLGSGAGLILENVVFYFASALLIFKIIEILSGSQRQAFVGTAFFVTATPVLEVGLSYLTDTGAWFFYLFSIFFTLKFFITRNSLLIPINGFVSGLSFLLKENGALGSLFWGMMILLVRGLSFKRKILNVLKFGVFFAIPITIVQLLGHYYLDYTHIDWFLHGMSAGDEEGFSTIVLRYVGQLFRILGILWPLVFIGLWAEIKGRNTNRLLVYAALLPSSFSFLLWSTSAGGRSVFIFAPLGIMLATFGWMAIENYFAKVSLSIKKAALPALLATIVVVNYMFVYVNQDIDFTDMLLKFVSAVL